ncbi:MULTISPECIES: hypothetical protein [Marinomonas]|uniref:Uncharacterized protein n=1 Tax=Marinomonas rhodophyticola TaxID=2992803 RepID=A0ABT3KDY6_9GAMM|nr:hypothetical protein [Marinomonas sp. KJ51-3]MCW4628739.1 hypothetical protein [Marinomonas sp. KJ51-3]
MSVSSISNNRFYLPVQFAQTDSNVRTDVQRQQDNVQLSDSAKQQLMSSQLNTLTDKNEEKEQEGKESVQVSSSIGRLSRITGLQREEVAALYRSIDKLT